MKIFVFEIGVIGDLPLVLQKNPSKVMQKMLKTSPRLEQEVAHWYSVPLMCKALVFSQSTTIKTVLSQKAITRFCGDDRVFIKTFFFSNYPSNLYNFRII